MSAAAAGSGLTVGVLALQGDFREHLAAVSALGARAVPVRRARELAAVDAVIFPGGESTAMSRLLRTGDLLEPLRAAIAGGLPAYGSCAGMILLADTVLDTRPDAVTVGGIDMTVRRNAFGRQVDSFEVDLSIAEVSAQPLRAVFIRAPWVEEVGPRVQVLAAVSAPALATGEILTHPVAVRQGAVLATSFHPEVTGDLRIHEYFLRLVRG